jgi:transposase-like protein
VKEADVSRRGPANPPGVTRAAVAERLARGESIPTIAAELGLVKSTVCYHARRLGVLADERFARRYDWVEIQRYYDEGHSIRDCARNFGFCIESWHRAVRAGLLVSRPRGAPIGTYLVRGRRTNRSHLKQRLIRSGLKENRCERCGIEEWRGEPLSMALHHINGDGLDNRLENISMLCPNCHSQTPNFSGRNIRRDWPARRLAQLGPRERFAAGERGSPPVGERSSTRTS